VASRRSRNDGAFGVAAEKPLRASPVVPVRLWRVPPAANDNKAPLRLKLRRLVFLATAAAAIGWLFWVGVLR
jgi:hypothetical protein